jgi:hypothetical protein
VRRRISTWRELLASAPLFFVGTLGVGMLLSGDSFAAGAVVAAVATVVWVGLMTVVLQRRPR